MATAQQYRDAAQQARSAVADAEEAERIIRLYRGDTGVVGGRLAGTIDLAIDSGVTNTVALADRCATLANELEQRAVICEQYTEAYAAFQTRLGSWIDRRERHTDDPARFGHPGARPSAPPTPEPWVTRG